MWGIFNSASCQPLTILFSSLFSVLSSPSQWIASWSISENGIAVTDEMICEEDKRRYPAAAASEYFPS